ncbi:MAG: competence protein ComEC [Anaerophaga sp.]|nr:competence protein ComEC [Anaerophaga sp.]
MFQDFLKPVPFLRFVIALATGIYCSEYLNKSTVGVFFAGFVLLFVCLLFVFYIPSVYRRFSLRWLCGVFILLFLFHLGVISSLLSRPLHIKGEYEVEATAEVVEVDVTYSGYWRIVVTPHEILSRDSVPVGPSDLWQIIVEPADSSFIVPVSSGNKIRFKTRLEGISSGTPNPMAFDYGGYLFRQGISCSGFVNKDDFFVESRDRAKGFLQRIKEARSKAYGIYEENGISGKQLQVLSALTLGMRQELDNEIKTWFVHSGVIHVLAVSGLHVGIIFLFLNYILNSFLPRRSLFRLFFVITVLVVYALLTGAAPSVLRAVIMLSVIQTGNYFRRQSNIYNLLCVSAFIILLIQPSSLFHVGFWLSHLAVAGIVTFYPLLHRFYAYRNIFVRSIGDMTLVSVSAQLGTFPLSLYVFRAFPCWFLVSNFFILPLIAPILVLANLLIVTSGSDFLSSLISGPLEELLTFMIEMVEWLNSLPSAYISGLWIGGLTMLLIYSFLITAAGWIYSKNRMFIKLALVSFLLIIAAFNVEYLLKRTTNAFVVFDGGRTAYVGTVNGGRGILYADQFSERDIDFVCSGFFARYSFDVQRVTVFENNEMDEIELFPASNGIYLGLGDINLSEVDVVDDRKDKIKGIVVLGETKGDLLSFVEEVGCRSIIIAGSCPPWCSEEWSSKLNDNGYLVHDVREEGAYVNFGDR